MEDGIPENLDDAVREYKARGIIEQIDSPELALAVYVKRTCEALDFDPTPDDEDEDIIW